jgi:hypothetical protein
MLPPRLLPPASGLWWSNGEDTCNPGLREDLRAARSAYRRLLSPDSTCDGCGALVFALIPVLYGRMPDYPIVLLEQEREAVRGGCCIEPVKWFCRCCRRWGPVHANNGWPFPKGPAPGEVAMGADLFWRPWRDLLAPSGWPRLETVAASRHPESFPLQRPAQNGWSLSFG